MRRQPPEDLTHTCPCPCPPILPPSPSPHLSVQLQPSLISTVSLQREPLKGQGKMAATATMLPTADLSIPRKVQAGLLIIEWCKR